MTDRYHKALREMLSPTLSAEEVAERQEAVNDVLRQAIDARRQAQSERVESLAKRRGKLGDNAQKTREKLTRAERGADRAVEDLLEAIDAPRRPPKKVVQKMRQARRAQLAEALARTDSHRRAVEREHDRLVGGLDALASLLDADE